MFSCLPPWEIFYGFDPGKIGIPMIPHPRADRLAVRAGEEASVPPASEVRKQPGSLRLPIAFVPGDFPLVLESQGNLVEPLEEALLGERPDFERVHRPVPAGHRPYGEIHRDLAPRRTR